MASEFEGVVARVRRLHEARKIRSVFEDQAHSRCQQLLEWIDAMRNESKLVDTPDGPKVMLPYSFMLD